MYVNVNGLPVDRQKKLPLHRYPFFLTGNPDSLRVALCTGEPPADRSELAGRPSGDRSRLLTPYLYPFVRKHFKNSYLAFLVQNLSEQKIMDREP